MTRHLMNNTTNTIRRSLAAALLTLLAAGVTAQAGNIFDDDWTPPPKTTPAAKPPVKPPTDKPPVDKPPVDNPPVDKPPVDKPPLDKPPVIKPPVIETPVEIPPVISTRRVVPDHAAQANSRKLMKEVFADQLKDTTPAGRRKLFNVLLNEAQKVASENPTDRFVLLIGAIEAAKDASELRLCFKAADELSSAYDIDSLAIRADAATKLPVRAYSIVAPLNSPAHAAGNAIAAENVRAGLEIVDQLSAAEDFTTAAKLTPVLQQGAAADPALRAVTQKEAMEIESARGARQHFDQDSEKLKSSPEDPAVNLSVGSYLCFRKGDWDAGLPMLAKSSDPAMSKLALAEAAKPSATDALVQLGDGWWEVGEKNHGSVADACHAHAAEIYSNVVLDASGLTKVKLEKRIAQAKPVVKSK